MLGTVGSVINKTQSLPLKQFCLWSPAKKDHLSGNDIILQVLANAWSSTMASGSSPTTNGSQPRITKADFSSPAVSGGHSLTLQGHCQCSQTGAWRQKLCWKWTSLLGCVHSSQSCLGSSSTQSWVMGGRRCSCSSSSRTTLCPQLGLVLGNSTVPNFTQGLTLQNK